MTAHRDDPDRGRAFFAKTMQACSEMMLSIVRCPKPVIAAANGIAAADLFDRAGDGCDQLLGQTVARVRPVQREDRDRALVLALKDLASCHALFRSVVHPGDSYPSAKLEPYIRGIVTLC
jgi:hypothetical protein